MKIIVGQAARKENFWGRETEVDNIWDAIDSGSHILLVAPRRVGKTSIMYKIIDEPRENYIALYIDVESADSENEFWKKLFKSIINEEFTKTFANRARFFFRFLQTINIDSFSSSGVKLGDSKEISYFEAFKQVIVNIDNGIKLIIMVDEFAQAIENIIKKGKEDEVESLLQNMRELRQNEKISDKVKFIYAGSIGLESVAKKIDSTKHINDLNPIPINTLDVPEAKMFVKELAENNTINLTDEQIDLILEKIEWLIPFHIQLIMQGLKFLRKAVLNNEDIDKAFLSAIEQRNHFEHWESRLKTFKDNEYKFTKEILNLISIHSTIKSTEIYNCADKHTLDEDTAKSVIRSLVYDGYINNNENVGEYRFNSAMLKMWWYKNVAN